MKILVINISLRPESPVAFVPMGLGYIVNSIHNAGYTFEILDLDVLKEGADAVQKHLCHKQYDVVLTGCIVTGYSIVKDVIKHIKTINPQTIVVVGNTVASSIPEHLLVHGGADVAVLGEGDKTVVELLKLLESGESLRQCKGIVYKDGEIVHTSVRPPIKNLDEIPFVNWDLFDVWAYINKSEAAAENSIPLPKKDIRLFPICSARGCVHKCTFCYHSFKKVLYRRRSNKNIIDEIETLINKYGINTFYLQDDLTFHSKKMVAEFVSLIEQRKLKFYWRATCCANLFQEDGDVELAKEMHKSGCISMGFSLESADMGILNAMNKRHTPEQFIRQAETFRQANIVSLTSLVVGYPTETPETIRKTIDCCIKARVYPSVGFLLPQPGSKMFDYAFENKYIRDMEEYLLMLGDRQDLRMNMTKIPDDQLKKLVLEEMERCNDALDVRLTPDSLIKTGKYRKANL